MGLIQSILAMFMKNKKGMPKGLDSIGELKDKAGTFMKDNSAMIDKVTDAIPGDTDNKIVDQAKDALK